MELCGALSHTCDEVTYAVAGISSVHGCAKGSRAFMSNFAAQTVSTALTLTFDPMDANGELGEMLFTLYICKH